MIITGATGMVGGCALKICLENPDVSKVTVIGRRRTGIAENGLLAIGFSRVHIFRPGYIYPVSPRKEPNILYSIFRKLYPAMRFVYPNIGIPSEHLARAMVYAGLYGTGDNRSPVLENRDIRFMEGV